MNTRTVETKMNAVSPVSMEAPLSANTAAGRHKTAVSARAIANNFFIKKLLIIRCDNSECSNNGKLSALITGKSLTNHIDEIQKIT